MGFRLFIKDEYDDDKLLVNGGTWTSGIHRMIKKESEYRNKRQEKCTTYPDCFMCDCATHSWNKIYYSDIFDVPQDILEDNGNIVVAFIKNYDDIPDDFLENKSKYCNKQFLDSVHHREYIWININ